MDLRCQYDAMNRLKMIAEDKIHSVLISGPKGSGKSLLARTYFNLLGLSDYTEVESKVDSLRSIIDTCYSFDGNIGILIENLDVGVVGASYTILKFLEEPPSHVYLVVTCQNVSNVPDTIISRSIQVVVGPPTRQDIENYAKSKYTSKYDTFSPILPSLISLKDVDLVSNYTNEDVQYILDLKSSIYSKQPITTIVWNLSHFKSGDELPLNICINYIRHVSSDERIIRYCIQCLKDLDMSRLPKHIILSKFVLECKYGD